MTDAQYRELFSKLHEGFFVAEVVRGDRGRVVDFVLLEANNAFTVQTGASLQDALGRRVSELIPDFQRDIVRRFGAVVDTGAPAAFEVEVPQLDHRWYEARAHALGGERFAVLFLEVTERKRIERALEENRVWLNAIVDSVDQMIWSTRPDGYHDFFNKRWYEYTGAAQGSTYGEAWAHLFHPDDRKRTFEVWRRSLTTGEPYEIEYRLKHRSGEYRWVLGRARPVRDESGQIIRWMGTCTDIDDARRVAEALRASEAKFRALYQARQTAHLLLSPDLIIEDVSQAYLDATMTRREDLIGKHLFEAFPDNPGDPAATGVRNLRASLARVLEKRAPDRMPVQKYDIRRPSGEFEVRWWAPLNTPVFSDDGTVRHIIHQVEDVTAEMIEREKAAEAQASEARFREVADFLPQLAWMADANGWIYWYNRRWYEYTGTTLEEMQGWGWRKVHHPDHVERVVKRIQHAWDTGEPWEDVFPLRGADGRYRWFLSRAMPVKDSAGRVIRWFGSNTDITEKQKVEDLQKTLIHEISHRVKNSLALVSALLALQARELDDTPRKALEDAAARVHAVARVHEQLSRQADAREIDLGPFIRNLADAIAATAPLHKTTVAAEPALVSADLAGPIGLVLNEFLTNAYKYAYPEGAEGDVRVKGARIEGGRYRLEVADFGQGLPSGFDLAKSRGSLGMRVITSLAGQLNGEIEAASTAPGARFTLTFPLTG